MSHEEPTTEGTNMDDHGETGTEGPGTEATSMMLMQMLMEQQRLAREQQAAQQEVLVRLVEQQREEMARYREEMRSVRTREEAAAARPKLPKPTLQKLGEKDDIENFLSTFERIAKQQDWPKEVWATQLAGLLTGKASAAYAAMVSTEALD